MADIIFLSGTVIFVVLGIVAMFRIMAAADKRAAKDIADRKP